MLQTDYTPRFVKTPRGSRALAASLVCLLSLLPALVARAQQPDNSNQRARTKRVTPLRTSDSTQGSRVTITSDGELNDYSAYRSGDRFIVVIPQAEGGGAGAGRGRGFEGAQVSRRGKDLVYTFKLAPGASARVNQRFNRLDVQFTAPKGSAQPAATTPGGGKPAATPAPTPRPQRTPAEIAGLPTPTPAARPTPEARVVTEATPESQQQTPAAQTATPGQTEVSPAFPTFEPSPAVEASPAPTVSEQIAQQAQPAAPAPGGAVVPAATDAAPRATLGTTLINNWPWIIASLLALGLGLLFVGRMGARREQQQHPRPARPTPALGETKAAPIATAATTTATIAAATTPPASPTAAAPVVAPVTDRHGTKKKKNRKGSATTAAAAPIAPAPIETAKPAETANAAGVEVAGGKVSVADVASALGAAGVVEEKAVAPAFDSERVGAEVKNLLAGEAYDQAVVGASDTATRQLVVAELSPALAGRNAERIDRARSAFLRYGYFDDAARDLQSAEAPGRRAAAAHTLSLVHDRSATPHLVSALEDPSADVRRAAVEALAELRDPAAAGPLEALRWREKSRHVPRPLILRAIEACAPVAEEEVAAEGVDETETTLVREETTAAAAAPPSAETDASVAAYEAPAHAVTPVIAPETEAAPVQESAATGLAAPELSTPELSTPEVSTPVTATPEVTSKEIELAESTAAVEEAAPAVETDARPAAGTLFERDRIEAPAANQSKTDAPPDPVYTFDESEAAAWASRRGAGYKPEDEQRDLELIDSLGATPAEGLPTYVAPEFAVAREEAVAEGWAGIEVDAVPARAMPESEVSARAPQAYAEESARVTAIEPVAPAEAGARDETVKSVESYGAAGASARAAEVADAPADLAAAETSFEITPYRPEEAAAERALDLPEAEEVGLAPAAEEFSGTRAVAESSAGLDVLPAEKGMSSVGEAEEISIIPKAIQLRLESEDASERAESVLALARLNTGAAYDQICAAFDDPAEEVRAAAARALHEVSEDRAESFTRALREAPPERRRKIGSALSASGLADDAISQLTGESRDRTYDAFSLLFLMAKAGETAPLIRAIEAHPDNEVRLAVVKLLALSGQQEVLPSFRRLAVRGSLPTEVRSAVMEAIYQISSSGTTAPVAKP